MNPFLWSSRSIIKFGTNELILAPVCDVDNPCYPSATGTLLRSNDLMSKYCSDCGPQCSISNILVQTSSLSGPTDWQIETMKTFVENASVPLHGNWSDNWFEQINKNYVGLRVVRETNVVENNTQSARIGFVDVLSNIGGHTGLWIGISFLSLMEFIEMIFRLVRLELHRVHHRFRRN